MVGNARGRSGYNRKWSTGVFGIGQYLSSGRGRSVGRSVGREDVVCHDRFTDAVRSDVSGTRVTRSERGDKRRAGNGRQEMRDRGRETCSAGRNSGQGG